MPCGGIYPCKPVTDDLSAWCHQCGQKGTHANPLDHFVEEWDNFLHRRCIPEFLLGVEGQITWINHGHSVVISETPGIKDNPIKSTMCTKLVKMLHGSKYVIFEEERELIFTWDGLHNVGVLDLTGEIVDTLTVGDRMAHSATLNEVDDAIKKYV